MRNLAAFPFCFVKTVFSTTLPSFDQPLAGFLGPWELLRPAVRTTPLFAHRQYTGVPVNSSIRNEFYDVDYWYVLFRVPGPRDQPQLPVPGTRYQVLW